MGFVIGVLIVIILVIVILNITYKIVNIISINFCFQVSTYGVWKIFYLLYFKELTWLLPLSISVIL